MSFWAVVLATVMGTVAVDLLIVAGFGVAMAKTWPKP